MKKTLIRSICIICALLMTVLSLFSCNSSDDESINNKSDYHTVKFNTSGGTPVPDVEIRHGQKLKEPDTPTRENYIFIRWEHNTDFWLFHVKEVTEDITLTARWISAADLFKIEHTDNPDELLIAGFKEQKSIHSLSIPEMINGKTVVGFTDASMDYTHIEHASHITIPSTVRSVGEKAFANIADVHIDFLGALSSLGVSSFEECKHLEKIKLAEGLTTIPYRCFFGASALKTIDIPKGVTIIEENAFTSCEAMQSVILPDTLTTIEDGAFLDASEMKAVFFRGTEEQFDALEISSNNNELLSANIYFYSEAKPETNGAFWHYDSNGTPILWN